MSLFLAHALPQSVGAVPLTLIITVVFGLFLAVNALGARHVTTHTYGGVAATQEPQSYRTDPRPKAGQLLGLIGLLVIALLATIGPRDPAQNRYDFVVLTVVWGGVGISSMLVGSWWWRVDPLRAVNGLLARSVGDPWQGEVRPLPQATATAVAVVDLLAWGYVQVFVAVTTVTFQLLLIIYVVVHVVGATRHGTAWLQQTESLNVLSQSMGRLRFGSVGPVTRLSEMGDTKRGRWISAALIGWSLADLLVETEWWHELGLRSSLVVWVGLVLLVGFTVGLYALMRITDNGLPLGPPYTAAAGGWVVAHYLSVLLADLFGLDLELVATLQVVPFVLAHLLAAVVVQRRAARVLRHVRQLSHSTFLAQALIAVLLVGGVYLQLGGI